MTAQAKYIWTLGGHRLHIEPTDNDWDKWNVGIVAHSLGRLSRWTGHVQKPESYSVAQHSVLVSYLTPTAPMAALFHDAAEFILGDITTPIKMHLGEDAIKAYRELTARWDESFARRFKFEHNALVHQRVKEADRLIQYYEAKYLVGVSGQELVRFASENEAFANWGQDPRRLLDNLPASVEIMLEPMPPPQAARAFCRRFIDLGGSMLHD